MVVPTARYCVLRLAADVTTETVLDVNDTSEIVLAELVSDNYAPVLKVQPALGRWFVSSSDADQVPAVMGLLLSVTTTSLLRGFLFGLNRTDPLTYAAAGILWIVVSLVASCIPAYRATMVDPLVALREE